MAGRQTHRDSRAAIFTAAAAEFAERGYEAARVDRIAATARVNKAMIYYHFGSKNDLYLDVLRDMFQAVAARARALADGPGTPGEKLDRWIVTIVDEAGARPHFPPMMLRELASAGAHLDAATVALLNAVFAAVRDIIVAGQQQRVFREADPLLVHLTIMPAVLIFFARARLASRSAKRTPVGSARTREQFIEHMQQITRRFLQKD